MNHRELLDLAWVELEASAEVLRYAEHLLTDEQVEAKVQELEEALRGMAQVRTRAIPFYLGLGAVGGAVVCGKFASMIPLSLCLLFSAITLLVCWALGSVLTRQLDENIAEIKKSLRLLVPITDTEACIDVKAMLDTGTPAVVAWRDLVLQDRSVLRLFDVHMLKALQAGSRRQARRLEQQNASEAIHKLPARDAATTEKA